MKKRNRIIVLSLFVIAIGSIIISIGYSSFSNILGIDKILATIRIEKDIRITNVTKNNDSSSSGVIMGDLDFNVKKIMSSFILPNEDSEIAFDVEIKNLGNVEMGIFSIDNLPDNLEYRIENYELWDKICDNSRSEKCKLGVVKNTKLIIGYKEGMFNPDDTSFDLNVDYDFEPFHYISYNKITNESELPDHIINKGFLKFKIHEQDLENFNVSSKGKKLIKDVDYNITDDGYFIIEDVRNDLSIYTEINFLDDSYAEEGEYQIGNLTIKSLGMGEFVIDGTTTNPNTYIRLSGELAANTQSPANLIDGSTILEAGNEYHLDVTKISGSYTGITGSGQMKFIFRGVNSATALSELGYDFWSGYIGEREGVLQNSLGMISYWIKASQDKPVVFDNFRFKVELTNKVLGESIHGDVIKTVTDGYITVKCYEDGLFTINGTSYNANNYIKIDGINTMLSSVATDLYTGGAPIVEAGKDVKIVYEGVANFPEFSNKNFTMNFRDNTDRVGQINDVKFSITGVNGTRFKIDDRHAEVSGQLSKDAGMLSMYFASDITFNNYSFYLYYEEL